MAELAVTAVGADRPGIIAAISRVLLDHGGNIEDSTMTILRGQFAMMLLVDADVDPSALERALAEATAELGLIVTVREVGAGAESAPPTHVLSVYGADRPGIVHAVTAALAARDINVTDLTTRVLEGEQPVYAMMLEVSLSADVDEHELAAVISRDVGGVEVSIHPLDTATF